MHNKHNSNQQPQLDAVAMKSWNTLTEEEKEFFFQETIQLLQANREKPKDKETIHQEAISLLAWYRLQIRKCNPEYSCRTQGNKKDDSNPDTLCISLQSLKSKYLPDHLFSAKDLQEARLYDQLRKLPKSK